MTVHDDALMVIHDSDCGFCSAVARWLERHDRRGRLRFEPIADVVVVRGIRFERTVLDEQMHVVDAAGRVTTGFRAWRRIAREVPLLMPVWPLLYLPGVPFAGDRIYAWVAANRTRISARLGLACRGSAVRTR